MVECCQDMNNTSLSIKDLIASLKQQRYNENLTNEVKKPENQTTDSEAKHRNKSSNLKKERKPIRKHKRTYTNQSQLRPQHNQESLKTYFNVVKHAEDTEVSNSSVFDIISSFKKSKNECDQVITTTNTGSSQFLQNYYKKNDTEIVPITKINLINNKIQSTEQLQLSPQSINKQSSNKSESVSNSEGITRSTTSFNTESKKLKLSVPNISSKLNDSTEVFTRTSYRKVHNTKNKQLPSKATQSHLAGFLKVTNEENKPPYQVLSSHSSKVTSNFVSDVANRKKNLLRQNKDISTINVGQTGLQNKDETTLGTLKTSEGCNSFDDICMEIGRSICNKKKNNKSSSKSFSRFCSPKYFGENQRKHISELNSVPVTTNELESRKQRTKSSHISFDNLLNSIVKKMGHNDDIVDSKVSQAETVVGGVTENNSGDLGNNFTNIKGILNSFKNRKNTEARVNLPLGSFEDKIIQSDHLRQEDLLNVAVETMLETRPVSNSMGQDFKKDNSSQKVTIANSTLGSKDSSKYMSIDILNQNQNWTGNDSEQGKIDTGCNSKLSTQQSKNESMDFLPYFPNTWSTLLNEETKLHSGSTINSSSNMRKMESATSIDENDLNRLTENTGCAHIASNVIHRKRNVITSIITQGVLENHVSTGLLDENPAEPPQNITKNEEGVKNIENKDYIKAKMNNEKNNEKLLDDFFEDFLEKSTIKMTPNGKSTILAENKRPRKRHIKRYRKGKMKIYRIKKLKKPATKLKQVEQVNEDINFDKVFQQLTQDIVETQNPLSRSKSESSVTTCSSYVTDITRSENLSTGSIELTSPQQRLRNGINELSKDKSLICCDKEVEDVTKEDKDELKMKIQGIFFKIAGDFVNKNHSSLKYRRQSFDNCIFKDNRLQLKPIGESSITEIRSSSVRSKKKFKLILYVMKKIQTLLSTNTKLTKRELYYQLKTFVNDQTVIDRIINTISCLLNVGMWALNIIAQKGLVFGNMKVLLSSGETLNCNVPGTLIPQDINEIVEIQSLAYFILVVEKESIFYKLIEEGLPDRLTRPFIMITGKGFPDLNTQLFLKKLWVIMSIPVFILVDADPHGINIMLNYRYGSVNNAHISHHLAVPNAKWLGVYPSEVVNLNLTREQLSERELRMVRHLLKTPYVECKPRIVDELNVLLEKKYKAEIEGLIKSDTYLSDVYLPNKFFTHNFI